MPRLRLNGLILFITSIFLAFAAVVTQTTHIQVKRPSRYVTPSAGEQTPPVDAPQSETATSQNTANNSSPPSALQFASVPVTIPLTIAATLGMLMWFLPTLFVSSTPIRRRRRRKRK
jgi:beta-lactamase regulating signal transducer with metallopeptidase domain